MSGIGSVFKKAEREGRRIDRQVGFRPARTKALGLAEEVEPIEEVEVIEEEAGEARRRRKKKLLTGGRRGTILSGIAKALKKRLGE